MRIMKDDGGVLSTTTAGRDRRFLRSAAYCSTAGVEPISRRRVAAHSIAICEVGRGVSASRTSSCARTGGPTHTHRIDTLTSVRCVDV